MIIMQWGAIIWLITALGGLLLGGIRISGGAHPPLWAAIAHGLGAVVGLGLVIWAAVFAMNLQDVPMILAMVLGILTASAGLALLLGFHLHRRRLPMPIVILHGMLGFVTVFVAIWAAFMDTFGVR